MFLYKLFCNKSFDDHKIIFILYIKKKLIIHEKKGHFKDKAYRCSIIYLNWDNDLLIWAYNLFLSLNNQTVLNHNQIF